ncbi:MAG: CoA-acylating methylmalonate-semialdehyde dehydrogenase [Oligoflexales bacterium]|nr:CoA-acylating methylmalonate-semialdehyde dehydrogenase [Oligoflexales bacterium]
MTSLLKNFIDGEWVESHGQDSVDVENPANMQLLASTPLGTSEDVNAAVKAAAKAFDSWKRVPAQDRVQYFFALKSHLEKHSEDLSRLITSEHGKTLAESKGEVRRAIQMVETACGIPTLMMGENFEDIGSGIDCATVNRPMGVFACIAPFNFPAMIPFWLWPFAVACGNTYVLKASERVPLTSIHMFELIEEIGFPKGVVNLVHGGKEVANALCTHPQVRGVSFVGSTPVAKHIYQTACHEGKRVQALGGAKNVMVVLPDAMHGDLEKKSVATAVESITGCAGERCLAGSLVLCVGDEAYEKFKDGAVKLVETMVTGDGLDEKTNMGPLISQKAKDRVAGLIERAVSEGAEILADGREGVDDLPGYFLRPSVLAGIGKTMEIAREEVFGPVILVSKVRSLEEAIEWINSIPYANTCTLFTNSGGKARAFTSQVDPSMIGINIGVPAPMAFFSFGGSKESFFGDIKAHGKSSVKFFTDTYTSIYRWHSDSSIW